MNFLSFKPTLAIRRVGFFCVTASHGDRGGNRHGEFGNTCFHRGSNRHGEFGSHGSHFQAGRSGGRSGAGSLLTREQPREQPDEKCCEHEKHGTLCIVLEAIDYEQVIWLCRGK